MISRFVPLLAGALLLPGSTFSQWQPVRSLGILNPFQDNPAAAGSAECLDLHVGHRAQWTGIEGAPVTSYANLHGQRSSGGPHFHGYGVRVEVDEAGAWSETSVRFGWAYNMRLMQGGRLAAGLSAGLGQTRLDLGSLRLPEVGAGADPAIAAASQGVVPEIDLGVWYYDREKFTGLSILQTTQPLLSKMTAGTRLSRQIVAVAGQEFATEGRWDIEPRLQVRLGKGLPPVVDVWTWLHLEDRVSLAVGYRNQSALLLACRARIAEYMTLAYAYDFGVGPLAGPSGGSHELVLGLNACRGGGPGRYVKCPAFD